MTNYSRQREAIVKYLSETTAHPTAEEIFKAVKPKYPNLSLATVYRNLGALAESGEILALNTESKVHYDGNTHPHAHVACRECGKVSDLELSNSEIAALNALCPDGEFELTFYNVCEHCKNK